MSDEGGGTATIEASTTTGVTAQSATAAGSSSVTDDDAGTGMVKVADGHESDPQPNPNRLPGESDQDFRKRMFDKVMGKEEKKPAVRADDGKFKKRAEGVEGQAEEDQAAKSKDEAKADSSDTPERREKELAARRALRRDEWTQEEIDELSPERLMEIGTRRAAAQAKVDAKLEGLQAPEQDEAATQAAAQREAEETATYAIALPADVLDYLTEPDKENLTQHVTQHVMRATKAAETRAEQASTDLLEERCVSIQKSMGDTYPALKTEKPPAEFLAKFKQLHAGGQYQTDTREGIAELMQDAATIVFGKQIKAQLQQQMIDANRNAIKNQPDPKTLSAATKPTALTRKEFNRMAYEETEKGGSLAEQRARLDKRVAGRQIVG